MDFFKKLFRSDSIEPLDVNCKIECACNCSGDSFDASAATGKDSVQSGGHLNGKKVS